MKRRKFLQNSIKSGAILAGVHNLSTPSFYQKVDNATTLKKDLKSPLAITMWDFSWLERRWPGAGYEDWDKSLSELVERGYNAVRIDAYPHLVAADPGKRWGLDPHWSTQEWGSPVYTEVEVQPNLNQFIKKCRDHGVKVGLSTWWREDVDRTAAKIKSGYELGQVWKQTLDTISEENLMDNIIYVDLSNEYPITPWTPYLPPDTRRNSDLALRYMKESTEILKTAYPEMPFCFSINTEFDKWETEDTSSQDILNLNIWITNATNGQFYREVGYEYRMFDFEGYQQLQLNGERVYREKEDYWLLSLKDLIHLASKWSRKAGLPVITTECWGPVDYRDFPLLSWDWVKEACEFGVKEAAKTGRWIAIATSNFCGPQFVGMWRDIEWHQELTKIIRSASIDQDINL
ncbi:MAG: cellulase-like family protein [Candidatus Cyclobacteriaceae bacterium M3_2C_046]